jgi:L-ascorbate metabolism protein UlaG (beta-lactamase superfamily)
VRITYVGHATVVIELDGTRLITDPVLRGRIAHLRRHVPVDDADLAGLDAALISHRHMDHLDRRSLRRLGEVPVIAPAGSARYLKRWTVTEMVAGDRTRVGALEVLATHAEHEGRRYPPLGAATPALGYRIDGSRSVYFAGDTELFEGMAEIGRPGLDLALLPVSGWGPRLGPGHLDAAAAARALALLQPKVAVPIHWGTLSSPAVVGGRGPSAKAAHAFAELAATEAPAVRVEVVPPGGTLEL